jgi:CPA2 family monovalent cation:H+ antiporter-2
MAARSPEISRIPDLLELTWVKLQPDSPLERRTIQDLDIRSQMGASVVGVVRQGVLYSNPGAEYCFAKADLVAVIGRPEECATFQALAALRE